MNGELGDEPAGPQLLKKKIKDFMDEACQKGYMTHPTRKTKIMFGKRYRNCVKKEGVNTKVTEEQAARIIDNLCVNCGDFANENLRKWFKDRCVNIGKNKVTPLESAVDDYIYCLQQVYSVADYIVINISSPCW